MILYSCYGKESARPHRKSGPRSQLWLIDREAAVNPIDTICRIQGSWDMIPVLYLRVFLYFSTLLPMKV